MIDSRYIKANEILQNPTFLQQLKQKETDCEVLDLFVSYGIKLSLSDIEAMCLEACEKCNSIENELNEDDLDSVSGGIVISATSAAWFFAGSALIGFFVGYAKKKYGR